MVRFALVVERRDRFRCLDIMLSILERSMPTARNLFREYSIPYGNFMDISGFYRFLIR